jgi:MFS family permease
MMRIVTSTVPQPSPRALPATLAPWRHKTFFAIWVATLVSNFGSLIQMVGASWLMTSLSDSADMVALVQSSTTLPILLFALVAGALADIHDRRIVMLTAQGLLLTTSIVLATVTAFEAITPWMLLGLTFLIGCGAALHGPAWQASVGEQVPREDIPAAVSLNSLGFNIARALGPAIGGVIVAASGATAAFVLNALTYLGIITVLVRWKRLKPVSPLPPERIVPAIFAGLQYVRLSPAIRSVLFRAMAFGLTGSGIWALAPLVARNILKGGPTTYGLLLGGIGLGAVGGALVSGRVRTLLRKETAVRLFTAAFGLAVMVVAYSPWKALSFAALLVAGACWLLTISTFNVTVQLASPRWVVGRAMSLMQMSLFGGMAMGSWIWGYVAERLGLPGALTIAGAGMVVSVLLGLSFRLSQTEKADLEPSRAGVTLDVDVPPGLQAAPVVVTVEYRVDPEDAAAFIDAMREKRRIRRRDGARRWTLMQDLANPEIWLERFHNPSWTDYLRQRHRATIADAEIEQRVRSFHRGDEPPFVRRLIEHRPEAAPIGHHDDHPHHEPVMRQGPLH